MANLNIQFDPPGDTKPSKRRLWCERIGIGLLLLVGLLVVLIVGIGGLKEDNHWDEGVSEQESVKATRSTTIDLAEGARAAEEMGQRIREQVGIAKGLIAAIYAEEVDGQLNVCLAEKYATLSDSEKQEIENGIAEIWRSTKYVKAMGFNSGVQFIEPRGNDWQNVIIRVNHAEANPSASQ